MPVVGEDDLARLGHVVQRDGRQHPAADPPARGVRRAAARFTSDVSHELRTPLTTVRMAADLLHESTATSCTRRCAARPSCWSASSTGSRRCSPTCWRSAGYDAGVAELDAEPVDLRAIVGECGGPVRAAGRAAPAPRWCSTCRTSQVLAEVDPRRVERILRNLLANAIDHGEGQPGRGAPSAADSDAVAVSVRDHGVGLQPGEAGPGVQPVLAGRPVPAAAHRRHRTRTVDQPGGRPPARRLAAGLGRGRPAAPASGSRCPLRHGERLRTSPLPLLPVAAAPAAAEPGIHDAAPTTGTTLPPPEADTGDGDTTNGGADFPEPALPEATFPEPTLPDPAPPSGPGTSSVIR